ncbi:peptidylprolyl isomerase [Catenovulum sp. SM1970]|uniref:peptidylprolyl isomerase n=1 Tax=Marinifaba aquimaris TaxID=2741323 RepID=UPI001571FB5B|nr:peptidylprolyl isomerase [Marinifaba aquimaris]NTS77028.1 peptidylprolyl isomerase [Marinifaba aquimaris]
MIKPIHSISTVLTSLFLSVSAHATVVQFQTSHGDFEVNLFDSTTPKTVENFINYVEAGAYQNAVVHRSMPDFIIQGGGFQAHYDTAEQDDMITVIETNDAVVNEPVLSNVKGTIAMAKLGDDPDSGTSQWFFNLVDNNDGLDFQNNGFTVFGVVLDDGLDVLEKIAALPRVNLGGAFTSTPMQGLSEEELESGEVTINLDNYVVIENIVVVNDTKDTFLDLMPPKYSNPRTIGDTLRIYKNESFKIPVLNNDTAVDSQFDLTSLAIVEQPEFGTAVVNDDGSITYTHTGEATATDKFSYQIANDKGELSTAAEVSVVLADKGTSSGSSSSGGSVGYFLTGLLALSAIRRLRSKQVNRD